MENPIISLLLLSDKANCRMKQGGMIYVKKPKTILPIFSASVWVWKVLEGCK